MNGDKIRVLLSNEEIQEKIRELAGVISRDYEGKDFAGLCFKRSCYFPL